MALDFLILYEHVVREYESILLLKAELARRGYTVELRQLLDRKKLKYFTLKKPKVLVSSCMYDDEAINSHVYNNIGVCNKVVNLHWEQMLSDTQEEGAWFNFGGNAKKCVQTCWGKRTQQRLVAHGMQEKNCPVTGAVMMDFLRPEFRGYFKDKAALCREHGLDPDKKLMLYISSFGYASMTEQEVKELSDMAGEDFTGFAGTNRTSMEQTLAWFDQYLAGHPEVQLVYRRHPSEWNSPALEALAQKRPNFRVIFADSVKQWIVAADQIFIWMSTAVAEVYFAGKSCRILRPFPLSTSTTPSFIRGGSHHGLRRLCRSPDAGQCALSRAKEVIEGYFDRSDTPACAHGGSAGGCLQKPSAGPALQPPFRPHFNLLKFCAHRCAYDVRGEIRPGPPCRGRPRLRRYGFTHLRLYRKGAHFQRGGARHGGEDRALCGLMPQCQNGARRPAGWRFGFPRARRRPKRHAFGKSRTARHSPPARQSASFVRKCAAAPCARAQNGVQ